MPSILRVAVVCLLLVSCQHTEQKATPDFLISNIDSTVSPASDFFEYANGGWIKSHPIPSDQSSWGIGYLVQEDIYLRLKAINEKAASQTNPPGSIAQKIGDFWFSGMDTAGIEKQGLTPLLPQLDIIRKISTKDEFLDLSADLGRIGVDLLMGGGVYQDEKKSDQMALHLSQGGIGLPDRDYYFNTDAKSVQVRKA